MLLGQVKGHVVSTAKVESLNGKKLMLVEVVSVREHGLVTTGREMVCIDAVQAGVGELVIVVQGSSARVAPEVGEVAAAAGRSGLVATLQAMGVDMELQA